LALNSLHLKISSISPLKPIEIEALVAAMELVSFAKNAILIDTDKVEKYLYFIEKGIARAYCYTQKQQATFWFGQEGDLILSYNSYIKEKPGYEIIELLEDSKLWRISHQTLQKLYTEHIGLANWGRKLAELELIKTEERFISYQYKTAKERYAELISQSPKLIQRVQLTHIASYLGVSPVTLSRIRAEIK
jgi:CRP-like cAMP-binding protein